MIKVIIVEDEKPIVETIVEILQNNCVGVEILGTAQKITSAKELIQNSNPDIVLLDINLTDGTSFELLENLEKIDFKIIFITAFEEFAIKAIKLSAIDYLVKPLDPLELIKAIDKAKEILLQSNSEIELKALLSNINNLTNKAKKIVLKTAESIHLIDVIDIIRCESDGAYTNFYLNEGKKVMVSKVLKDYEEMLQDYGFMRVHKSHIINLNYIDRFEKADGGYLILKDKSSIPVSVRKKESLMKNFEKLSS